MCIRVYRIISVECGNTIRLSVPRDRHRSARRRYNNLIIMVLAITMTDLTRLLPIL